MWKSFMEFINRGNVLDLAVAVIIGAAFGAITTSLVNQVIMPVIGLIIGGVDFSNLGFILKDRGMYSNVQEAVAAGAPVIQLGAFINTLINFLIIAFVVFLIVRAVAHMQQRLMPKKPEVPAAPPEPTREEVLLTEIRDLLAKSS